MIMYCFLCVRLLLPQIHSYTHIRCTHTPTYLHTDTHLHAFHTFCECIENAHRHARRGDAERAEEEVEDGIEALEAVVEEGKVPGMCSRHKHTDNHRHTTQKHVYTHTLTCLHTITHSIPSRLGTCTKGRLRDAVPRD